MKRYKISNYDDTVVEVEVERETDFYVFFKDRNGKERRDKKVTTYNEYFDTRDAAIDDLINTAKERLSRSVRDVEYHTNKLAELREKYGRPA